MRSRAETTITTYAMQNATCARITVYMPSCKCRKRNAHWNSASSETPVTISGVTSERYSDPVSRREPRFQSRKRTACRCTVEIAVAAHRR